MRSSFALFCILSFFIYPLCAQQLNSKDLPGIVRSAFATKYPQAQKVTWEKEKGNFEANWGGRSGEDSSAQFSPAGNFLEITKAISINLLPKSIDSYLKEHYKGSKIIEAGKVTDAHGEISYEVEVNKKDLIFNDKGDFIK
jgi:hypothetical protein